VAPPPRPGYHVNTRLGKQSILEHHHAGRVQHLGPPHARVGHGQEDARPACSPRHKGTRSEQGEQGE
jgi:hypothetical protein